MNDSQSKSKTQNPICQRIVANSQFNKKRNRNANFIKY